MNNAYDGLVDAGEERHWAFGTGFTAALSGVDRALPADVDREDLTAYCLMLGDDALILSQRLTEWCSRAPELEEDVALANIALDLLGQARLLLTRAAEADGVACDEDTLAFTRDEHEFRNVRLVEIDCGPGPGGDFAATIARLLVFATYRLALLQRLTGSRDPVLAAVAAKGVKEVAYHRDHAAQWTLRLAGGTEFSRERMVAGLDQVWPYVDELFTTHPVEARLADAGIAVDPADLRAEVDQVLDTVFAAADLARPEIAALASVNGRAGRDGVHTEAMGYLLAEMQHINRSMPGAVW